MGVLRPEWGILSNVGKVTMQLAVGCVKWLRDTNARLYRGRISMWSLMASIAPGVVRKNDNWLRRQPRMRSDFGEEQRLHSWEEKRDKTSVSVRFEAILLRLKCDGFSSSGNTRLYRSWCLCCAHTLITAAGQVREGDRRLAALNNLDGYLGM